MSDIKCLRPFVSEIREKLTPLQFGGYPAPVTVLPNIFRWQSLIRDSILEPVLSRNILQVKPVHRPALPRQTLELALRYPAQEISLQKFLGQLQDKGNAETVRDYLWLLKSTYLIKLLQKYSHRPLTEKASSPSILPLCPAFIHAEEGPERIADEKEWKGRVLEAVVGAYLL